MFGYIAPYRPELKLCEDAEYRAHYCGLCKALGARRGLIGRAVLRYDMAFISLLADAVNPEGDTTSKAICAIHPLGSRIITRGKSTEFAADLSIILLWGKLIDDKRDGDATGILLPIASIAARSALRRMPHMKTLVTQLLDSQEEAEHHGASPDEAAEPSANFMRSLLENLPGLDASDKNAAGWLGYNLGKWIYIIDAVDDMDKDEKKQRFNPLSGKDHERIDFLLTQCTAQAEASFSLMNIYRHEGVLTNILTLGLNDMSRAVFEKTRGKGAGDGSL